MTDKTIAVPDWHTDPYLRIVNFFDMDATAGSFLAEDGEGGFAGAIHRMAREIDRLRSAQPPQEHLAGLPQDVINLVIAAREAFDTGMLPSDENNALNKALEAFSSRVPYENEPDLGYEE